METFIVPPPDGDVLTIPQFMDRIQQIDFYGVYSCGHQDLPSDIRIVWLIDGNSEYLPQIFKVRGSADAVQTAWRAYMKKI